MPVEYWYANNHLWTDNNKEAFVPHRGDWITFKASEKLDPACYTVDSANIQFGLKNKRVIRVSCSRGHIFHGR